MSEQTDYEDRKSGKKTVLSNEIFLVNGSPMLKKRLKWEKILPGC
jgi:hypothetical protein